MFCTKCGSQVSSDVQFCPTCGQPLAAGAGASSGVPPVAWIPPVGVKSQTGRWIGEGWQMVKLDMGNYVLMALVVMALNGMVPVILQGPLFAGFHIFCMKKTLNRPTDFADLFKGFNYFVPTLVASLVISLFVVGGTLVCIIPGLVVAAMYKFTYLFIVDKRMDFWPAMQASHAVVKNDYFGFTVFLLAMAGVNILGALCCIVGLLVSIPVTIAAITVAYKEIVGFDPRTVETI
jgi:uncharacterized membrane protein